MRLYVRLTKHYDEYRLKAGISFHEKMFFTAIAMMLGLLGWVASNYLSASTVVLFLAMIGLFGTAGFGVWNYKRIKQLLERLENAE